VRMLRCLAFSSHTNHEQSPPTTKTYDPKAVEAVGPGPGSRRGYFQCLDSPSRSTVQHRDPSAQCDRVTPRGSRLEPFTTRYIDPLAGACRDAIPCGCRGPTNAGIATSKRGGKTTLEREVPRRERSGENDSSNESGSGRTASQYDRRTAEADWASPVIGSVCASPWTNGLSKAVIEVFVRLHEEGN
jgi:hypothetical protein